MNNQYHLIFNERELVLINASLIHVMRNHLHNKEENSALMENIENQMKNNLNGRAD